MPGGTGQPTSSVALIANRYELVRELRAGGDTVDWEGFDTALERVVVVQLMRPDQAHDSAAAERFWNYPILLILLIGAWRQDQRSRTQDPVPA